MKKILITALAFAGFAIAAPNHITKSNYTTYTSWDKDSLSYYAFNEFVANTSSSKCYKNSVAKTNCNIAAVQQANLSYGLPTGTVYIYKHISISPVTTIKKVRYDADSTVFYYSGYGGVTHIAKHDSSFFKKDWSRKGMPMKASELKFAIDTVTANYGSLKNKTVKLTAQYDTLKTSSHNYKKIIKNTGCLYIPAGEYYLDSLAVTKNVEVKPLTPGKATIIHVKNGATWTPKSYINRPNAGSPDLFEQMAKSFLIVNHGKKDITISDLKGSVIAPYSTVNVQGLQYGNVLAKNVYLSGSSVQTYHKFAPTSW